MTPIPLMKTASDLIPDYIRGIRRYVPGRPIEEVERELKIHAVKLASNENPLGPSPRAIEAARAALEDSNRYPDGDAYYLREALAAKYDVPAENIIIGLGSSELIDLSARLAIHSGEDGITSEGSFALYYIAIQASGGNLVTIPLADYAFDLDAIARAITSRTRYIAIANPNNPTGTLFTADEFETFLARVPDHVLVVLGRSVLRLCEPSPVYTRD